MAIKPVVHEACPECGEVVVKVEGPYLSYLGHKCKKGGRSEPPRPAFMRHQAIFIRADGTQEAYASASDVPPDPNWHKFKIKYSETEEMETTMEGKNKKEIIERFLAGYKCRVPPIKAKIISVKEVGKNLQRRGK